MQKRLFGDIDLRTELEKRAREVRLWVEGMAPNEILTASVDDIVVSIVDRFTIEPPAVKLGEVEESEPSERYLNRTDRSFQRTVRARIVTIQFFVPVSGEPRMFRVSPSTSFLTDWAEFSLDDREVVLTYEAKVLEPEEMRRWVKRKLGELEIEVGRVAVEVSAWNSGIADFARPIVELRRAALERDSAVSGALGFKVRRRGDAPRPVPMRPKRLSTTRRRTQRVKQAAPAPADPTLEKHQYDEIVDILRESAVGMERSPMTLAKLEEEEIRDMLLVVLNSHFEGQASGETFRGSGRTDILVPIEGRNVFVGECKIYDGQKVIGDALDQLLGYLVWRDAFAALVVVIRDRKEPTRALRRAVAAIEGHSSFLGEANPLDETTGHFEWRMQHSDDPERVVRATLIPIVIRSTRLTTEQQRTESAET